MSELQLSAKLVDELRQTLVRHDGAASDPGVASQYLCAVVGFLLGQQEMEAAQKDDVLDQLGAFMKHVADDVDKQRRSSAPPPAPPAQEAFGIWTPKSENPPS